MCQSGLTPSRSKTIDLIGNDFDMKGKFRMSLDSAHCPQEMAILLECGS